GSAVAVVGGGPLVGMIAPPASTGFYTVVGGVRSSSYVEFVQTIMMVTALLFAVPVVITHAGGLTALGEYVGSIEPRMTGWWFGRRGLNASRRAVRLLVAARARD